MTHVGLAYPNAISIVKSCIDTAKEVGLPEARFALAQATVLLATSPKSFLTFLYTFFYTKPKYYLASLGDFYTKLNTYKGLLKLGKTNNVYSF